MNTNKFYAFIIILIFIIPGTSMLQAQESNKGKINFGFDGGVQFTNTNNNTTLNPTSRKTGYILGPYAEYFISDLFSVKLGLYFDNRGFKIDDLYVGLADSSQIIPDSIVYSAKSYLHITRNYSINYLTIPLSISYVKGSGRFKIYVQAGIYYSLLLNATQNGSNDLYIDQPVSATATVYIDTVNPGVPGALSFDSRTGTTMTVQYGATSTETNFNEYKIIYKIADGTYPTESDSIMSSTSTTSFPLTSPISLISPTTLGLVRCL